MHAITVNKITCAWPTCLQPGDTLIIHRAPSIRIAGTDHTVEAPAVPIEYCARHADAVTELAAERRLAVPA